MIKEQRERLIAFKEKISEISIEIDSMRTEPEVSVSESDWMAEVSADLEACEDTIENCLSTEGATDEQV